MMSGRRAQLFLAGCVLLLLCVGTAADEKPSPKGSGSVSPLTEGLMAGLAAVKKVLVLVLNAIKIVLGAINPCLPNGVINCDQSLKEFAGAVTGGLKKALAAASKATQALYPKPKGGAQPSEPKRKMPPPPPARTAPPPPPAPPHPPPPAPEAAAPVVEEEAQEEDFPFVQEDAAPPPVAGA
ncbi:hypothetical protein T484DRAFT_1906652 [Baffinella frigidus]|nr:hypothetical protein T484DRAFT_1906652 [Cryptophyta sp. CCMP2293]